MDNPKLFPGDGFTIEGKIGGPDRKNDLLLLSNNRSRHIILKAYKEADLRGENHVGPEHFLVGLLQEDEGKGLIAQFLTDRGVTIAGVRRFNRVMGRQIVYPVRISYLPDYIYPSPDTREMMQSAMAISAELKHGQITPEHILIAMIEQNDTIPSQMLIEAFHLKKEKLRKDIYQLMNDNYPSEYAVPIASGDDYHLDILDDEEDDYKSNESREENEKRQPAPLRTYTTNLTKVANEGNLDPVIGRDKEIARIIQILLRRRKNNPILIGEPGVGKTAVVEGLAQQIVKDSVPGLLSGKRILSLDISLILAGTQYRGEFEDRLNNVISLVCNADNIILFIDEVHTLVGAGGCEGSSMDAANMLKPALARGELQCIGATTIDEYQKHIEKDSALERRFQPVKIDQPSIFDTILILNQLKPNYEKYHNVKYTKDAIEAAVYLSTQYIADRYLPDKAVDLVDEGGALVRIKSQKAETPEELVNEHLDQLKNISAKKAEAIFKENYSEATVLLSQEREIKQTIEMLIGQKQYKDKNQNHLTEIKIVTENNIAMVVSTSTGIPLTKISEEETRNLLATEENLQKQIIGQEPAVSSVSKAIRRSRVGLRDPNRPIASFIFAGPTGVGKTELAKAIANSFFGGEHQMIRLDMSEYLEPHNVAKLIGPPPGYVGYSEGGQLTEAVRRKPYSVVLFDEIEKSHKSIYNVLLQILEDGRLTDSKGRVADFKNTMIILTSNVGASQIIEQEATGSKEEDYINLQSLVNEQLKKKFRPELLNRLDEIIVFRQLTKADLQKIAEILLSQLNGRAKEKGFEIKVSDRAKNLLIDEGYNPVYGARPLRRAIMNLLEDRLANEFLNDNIPKNSVVLVQTKASISKDRIQLDIKIQKPADDNNNNADDKSTDNNKMASQPGTNSC